MSTFLYKDFGLYNKAWDARMTVSADVLDDPDFLPVKSDYETEYSEDSVDNFRGLFAVVEEIEEEIFDDWRSDSSFTVFTMCSESSVDS
jgi:hypothetical protein